VIKMASTATILSLGTEFDAFLFAPIGEEENGMPLSVLSALARLDLDPWREAAELAHLPQESADRRFASLIEALPNRPLAGLEAKTISARLVALLPRMARSSTGSNERFPDGDVAPSFRAFILVVLLNLFIVVGMMGAERVAASFRLSAGAGDVQSSTAGPVRAEGLPRGDESQ
jgi:hypothetical protein